MRDYVAMYLLTRDEFCLKESCQSLFDQGVKKFFFCVPPKYWDGTPVTKKEVIGIQQIAKAMKDQGAFVSTSRPPIPPNGTYAYREASARNTSMKMCKKMTGKARTNILIVDSDEIWANDSLQKLEEVLNDIGPEVVTASSLDIIGFPGYPVTSRNEGLLIYVRDDGGKFIHGRCFNRPHHYCPEIKVTHFTSTRTSMEDTIRKHLRSTHYDDSDYEFDKWIKETLPNIKPGMKDCHMYKHWKVWDEVRYFTKEEWKSIPDRLKKYLGEPI